MPSIPVLGCDARVKADVKGVLVALIQHLVARTAAPA